MSTVRRISISILATLALSRAGVAEEPTHGLERFRGQVVLVDFWASWCGPCAESFPWMAEMMRRHGPQGLVVLAVNLDEDRVAAERFLAGKDWPFQLAFDSEGQLAEAFALRVMPTSLLRAPHRSAPSPLQSRLQEGGSSGSQARSKVATLPKELVGMVRARARVLQRPHWTVTRQTISFVCFPIISVP